MSTIGVSIAVPEPWGSELQQYRIDVGDESARGIPTHITLLPPYVVDDADLEGVVTHLERAVLGVDPFRVHLRSTGTFQPVSPVVFVNVVEGIAACEQLAAGVRRGPLAVESDFPYHPHVTIAHHLPEPELERAFVELAGYDVSFEVDRMWLYLHQPVTGWLPTRSFPLSSGSASGPISGA